MSPLGRALSAGVVHIVVAGEDDLGDGDHGVAIGLQIRENGGEGLRRVDGGVVKEADGAAGDLACNPLGDVRRRQLLPVQAVPHGSSWKRLK